MSDILLQVIDLKKYFKTTKGMLHAVDGVSFYGKGILKLSKNGC